MPKSSPFTSFILIFLSFWIGVGAGFLLVNKNLPHLTLPSIKIPALNLSFLSPLNQTKKAPPSEKEEAKSTPEEDSSKKAILTNGQNLVMIYFLNPHRSPDPSNCQIVYGTHRSLSHQADMATTALHELFKGPTSQEKELGYSSVFYEKTADLLLNLTIKKQTAYLNLKDFRDALPHLPASCQSQEFFAEISETLKACCSVEKVLYALEGDPKTFYEWMQIGCHEENNRCDPSPFQ